MQAVAQASVTVTVNAAGMQLVSVNTRAFFEVRTGTNEGELVVQITCEFLRFCVDRLRRLVAPFILGLAG